MLGKWGQKQQEPGRERESSGPEGGREEGEVMTEKSASRPRARPGCHCGELMVGASPPSGASFRQACHQGKLGKGR